MEVILSKTFRILGKKLFKNNALIKSNGKNVSNRLIINLGVT